MRQNVRRAIGLVSLLLFPLTMNYLSPYISLAGAASGLFVASMAVFAAMLVGSMLLGRLWCGWFCPIVGLAESCAGINGKPVNLRVLRTVRYIIWALWLGTLLALLAAAGGFHGVRLLFFTEHIVSVDAPAKYIVYFMVLAVFLLLNLVLGRRGACHTLCWMSPFMELGSFIGRALRLPQLHIDAEADRCNACGQCSRKCPMSIDVRAMAVHGGVHTTACILCGECSDACRQHALHYSVARVPLTTKRTPAADRPA